MSTHYVLARYEKGLNLPPSYCVAGKGWTLSIGQASSFNYDDLVEYINCIVQDDCHFRYAIEHRTQALEDRLHPELMRRAVGASPAQPTHPHKRPIDIRIRHRFSRSTLLLMIAVSSFSIGYFVFPLPIAGWAIAWAMLIGLMAAIGWRTKRFESMMLRVVVGLACYGLGAFLASN